MRVRIARRRSRIGDDDVTIVRLRSSRRRCRHVAREGVRAKSGMRMRCRNDGEHKWVSGDNDAVAIVRLRLSRRRRHHVVVASARAVRRGRRARVRWASGHDDAMAIVWSRSSCRHHRHVTVVSATVCGGMCASERGCEWWQWRAGGDCGWWRWRWRVGGRVEAPTRPQMRRGTIPGDVGSCEAWSERPITTYNENGSVRPQSSKKSAS